MPIDDEKIRQIIVEFKRISFLCEPFNGHKFVEYRTLKDSEWELEIYLYSTGGFFLEVCYNGDKVIF